MTAFLILIFMVLAAVVVVLVFGISNFGREGETAAKRSNKMMQLRVLLQAVAVGLIMLFIYLNGTGN